MTLLHDPDLGGRLRLAKHSDLSRVSELLAAAFREENLNRIIFPHRNEFYPEFVRSWRHTHEERWWDYSRVYVVSTTTEDHECDTDSTTSVLRTKRGGREVITGVATWQRVGPGWERLWGCWGWWDARRLLPKVVHFFTTLHRRLFGNKAAPSPSTEIPNPLTLWNFEGLAWPFFQKHMTEPAYRRTHWELSTIGVDPKYQGHGVGKELIRWGMKKATDEELPVVVIGSQGTEPFYKRCGFEFLVGYATEGDGNPLNGLGGGAIMWTRVKDDEEQVQGSVQER